MSALKHLYIAFAFLIFISVTPSSYAEEDLFNYDPALGKVKTFKPDELPEKMQLAEKSNNPEIQYVLGYMYQYGDGLPLDDKNAIKWYKKAAESGHSDAMVALGRLYKFSEQYNAALSWFNKAAKNDNPYGWYELGSLYEEGKGVFPNEKKAFESYKIAASKGAENAYLKLGFCYQYGRGVPKDLMKAREHFKHLYEAVDDPDVRKYIARLMGRVYRELASQNEENTEEYIKWIKVAAEFGDVNAIITVANAYRDGKGVVQDNKTALEWYQKAAEYEDVFAMQNIGYMYTNGLGTEQDYKEAVKWYTKCAELGSSECAWYLGNLYLNGQGVEKSETEANKWFKRVKR